MIRVNDLKSHYSIKILVALVLVKLGTAGAVSTMTANFVEPIVKELGCDVSEFTMTISINAIHPLSGCRRLCRSRLPGAALAPSLDRKSVV